MAKAQRTISDVVRDIMRNLPGTEEFVSHGLLTFRANGRVFAVHSINHHGDGRVALNLLAPRGAQAFYTNVDPDVYFVPAYVGSKGWLGVQLDQGASWADICEHVVEAYNEVAKQPMTEKVVVQPPTRKFRPEEIDPFQGKRAKQVLKRLASLCSGLPETSPATQFGAPVWKAGKKTFVCAHFDAGRFKLSCWVGKVRQKSLTKDRRYAIPPYTGGNGWIDLDVHEQEDWPEIESLVLDSYRHFALKRMLKALDESE